MGNRFQSSFSTFPPTAGGGRENTSEDGEERNQELEEAQVQVIRSWANGLASLTAGLQQQPVGPATDGGISFVNGTPALFDCYSIIPVLSSDLATAHSHPSGASVLPVYQLDAEPYLTEYPLHPPLNMQYGVSGVPQQFPPAAGNPPPRHHNAQSSPPENQEQN
ncbi:unnamed protein product [Victoria cruziana]